YGRAESFSDASIDATTVARIVEAQRRTHLNYVETRLTDTDVDELDRYRTRLPCETQTFELTGISPAAGRYFTIDELRAYRLSNRYQLTGRAVQPLQYHEQPDETTLPPPAQKRLLEHVRTLYFDDADDGASPSVALPFAQHGARGLKYEDYRLALTTE